jgi:hypothetical protein
MRGISLRLGGRRALALGCLVWSFLGGAGSPAARAAAQPMGWVMGGFLLVWIVFWTKASLVGMAGGRKIMLLSSIRRRSKGHAPATAP